MKEYFVEELGAILVVVWLGKWVDGVLGFQPFLFVFFATGGGRSWGSITSERNRRCFVCSLLLYLLLTDLAWFIWCCLLLHIFTSISTTPHTELFFFSLPFVFFYWQPTYLPTLAFFAFPPLFFCTSTLTYGFWERGGTT